MQEVNLNKFYNLKTHKMYSLYIFFIYLEISLKLKIFVNRATVFVASFFFFFYCCQICRQILMCEP